MSVFKKNLNLLKQKPKNKNSCGNNFKTWFLKWDRTIAALTAVIVFFIMLTFVIVNIKVFNNGGPDSHEKVPTKTLGIVVTKTSSSNRVEDLSVKVESSDFLKICTDIDQGLLCSSTKADNLRDAIDYWTQQTGKNSVNKLQLQEIEFTSTLEQGWLEDINITSISSLTIQNTDLTLGEKAFSGNPFTNLKTLSLNDVSLSDLKREIFEESKLQTLEIACSNSPVIEENAFGALSRSLETLQLLKCIIQRGTDEDILTKITGSSEVLSNLKRLDLQFNDLGTIKATSFQSAPSLKQLFLSFSTITQIENYAFNNQYLEQLDLNNNKLTTLPESVFETSNGIVIINNPWKCNCSLVWLRNLVENDNNKKFTPSSFDCTVGDESLPYQKVDFCSESSTTYTSSSNTTLNTIMSSEFTTEVPSTQSTGSTGLVDVTTDSGSTNSTIKIKCMTANTEFTYDGLESHPEIYLQVRNGNIIIKFDRTDSPNDYLLTLEGDVDNQNLLWIRAEDSSQTFCLKNLNGQHTYRLDKLSPESTYIFCVMSPDLDTVSPFDCGAITIPVLPKDEPWIKEEFKTYTICGIIGSLLLAILISSLIVFYCIRQHPSLIKGNKRVIIVESEAADAIVMPKYYEAITYNPPSLRSASNGYLTPKNHGHYAHVCDNRGPQVRTISETTPIVVASTSGVGRLNKSYYRKRTRMEQVTHSYDEHMYEPPPPLPPNHPLGLTYNDSLNRNYSQV